MEALKLDGTEFWLIIYSFIQFQILLTDINSFSNFEYNEYSIAEDKALYWG